MRLDRIITLNVVGPIRSLTGIFSDEGGEASRWAEPLPVLMYHGITSETEPGVAPYYKTNTDPANFRKQIQCLYERGYRTISLKQAFGDRREFGTSKSGGMDDGASRVIITFDDGFRDFYTQAFPILQEFGFSATVFLPTGFIENISSSSSAGSKRLKKSGGIPRAFVGKEFLRWGEVREIHRAGIEIGSHTVNHPRLIDLSWDEIEREIKDSKLEIEAELNETITTFAYPFAFPQGNESFIDRLKECLKETGYQSCVTTEVGRARRRDELFRIKRLPMNSCDDERLLCSKLKGDYDWLGVPQSGLKRLKGIGISFGKKATIKRGGQKIGDTCKRIG